MHISPIAMPAATLPGVAWSGDPAAVIADPAIRAVVIVTPTDTHAALIEAAAHVPKHRVATKPTRASKERRIQTKKNRSTIKRGRSTRGWDHE